MADVSLDDYIKTHQITRGDRGRGRGAGARGGRGGMRGRALGRRSGQDHGTFRSSGVIERSGARKNPFYFQHGADTEGRWRHDLFGSGAAGAAGLASARFSGNSDAPGDNGAKLVISNLDSAVSETDIRELFGEFGPLRKVTLHFDQTGRSLGTADVQYIHFGDAVNARSKYNGVPLDGRCMEIQMPGGRASDNIRSSRFGRGGGGGGGGGGPFRRHDSNGGGRFRPDFDDDGGYRANRGLGRGGSRGGGFQRRGKPEVTQEQLDMELDDLTKS